MFTLHKQVNSEDYYLLLLQNQQVILTNSKKFINGRSFKTESDKTL